MIFPEAWFLVLPAIQTNAWWKTILMQQTTFGNTTGPVQNFRYLNSFHFDSSGSFRIDLLSCLNIRLHYEWDSIVPILLFVVQWNLDSYTTLLTCDA